MRLLLTLLLLTGLSANAQPLWRNFWTTNQNPRVTVVAGSNATVQASTVGVDQRIFTVNGMPSGSDATNGLWTAVGVATNQVYQSGTNTAGTYKTDATNGLWTAATGLTNVGGLRVYGSNVVSGGQVPIAALSGNNGANGWFLIQSNSAAVWGLNGASLTNVPFTFWTNYTSNPNDSTNLNGLAYGSGMYGMTSFWSYATAPGVGPIGIFYNGIDTNTVISTNGGSFSGRILDISASASAPISNQLVTASWVRNLFNTGAAYYNSTNIQTGATNADMANQYVYSYQSTIPLSSIRTYTATDFLTNNGYVGAVVTTNTFSSLAGTIVVNAYLAYTAGGGASSVPIKPEIYISSDRTNWYNEVSASSQNIASGTTNLYQWLIDFPSTAATNAAGFYVQRRFKVTGTPGGSGTKTLYVFVGTNAISGTADAAHLTMQSPTATAGNAYLANNQVFTGSNTFSVPIVGNGMALTNLSTTNLVGTINASIVGQVPPANLATNAAAEDFVLTGTSTTTAKWSYPYLTNTVATLPAAPTGPGIRWCSDVITSSGVGAYVRWDWNTSTWRTWEGVQATADHTNFILNAFSARLWADSSSRVVRVINEPFSTMSFPIVGMTTGTAAEAGYSSAGGYGVYWVFTTGTDTTGNGRSYGLFINTQSGTPSTNGMGGGYIVSALCDGTDKYWAWVGCGSATTATFPTDGAGFLYDMYNANSVVSNQFFTATWTNNWLCVSGASSSYTYKDTGLPVSASTAAINRLHLIHSGASVLFFTNGVLAQTIDSNVPVTSLYLNKHVMVKTAGTTSRSLRMYLPALYNSHAARTYP